jgi:hypothetical protein
MALVEKTTQEDLMLFEILRNPILFSEFVQNIDKYEYEEQFELTDYQKEFLADFHNFESICCARSVGKTVSLTNLILWYLIFDVFPNDFILYTVPSKVHLEPVFTSLIRMFRANSFLKNFMDRRGGINSSEYSIKPLNNTTLMCRIAGQSGTGANVIGLHTPVVILDEGGYYPWGTWRELQPTLNSWTPGFKLIVSGVPTGLRENNVLYHCDQENSSYTKHRISALLNPRFNEDEAAKALEDYGGSDTDDYIHLVLGQHGKPVFALFDRGQFEIKNYPVYKLQLNGLEYKENISEYITRIAAFPSLDKSAKVIFGIDLGYTEPTAIVILYFDTHGRLLIHGRVQLNKVAYPIQERIIDRLDDKFHPTLIGIDKGSGGSGIHVIQSLTEGYDYLHKNYKNTVIPVDFSSSIVLGMDSNGEEIKSKTKPFSVSVLQDYTNNHKIIFSSTDMEMISELERMTYSKTPTGEIIYKTLTPKGGKRGEDHFTQALLCASLANYLNTEFLALMPGRQKLIGFGWI